MGKKPQKTKELSVAIAEASSSAIDVTVEQERQPQPQPQAPRKRGRPRKIIVRMESAEEKKVAQPIEQEAASIAAQGMLESSMEKGKGNNEEEQREESSQACISATKQEGVSEEMQLPKGVPSRSRARRKSKPRKSS